MEAGTSARGDRAFLAFAAVCLVFHQFPSVLLAHRGEAAVDVLTPFAVAASSVAVLLALGASRGPLLASVLAGVMYAHGHGVHLAANSIHNEGIDDSVVYFWDERFSHIELVLGWFGLVAVFCFAERATPRSPNASPRLLGLASLLLGWTFFTSTVQGQTWWLELPVAAVFGIWALRSPRPLLRAAAQTGGALEAYPARGRELLGAVGVDRSLGVELEAAPHEGDLVTVLKNPRARARSGAADVAPRRHHVRPDRSLGACAKSAECSERMEAGAGREPLPAPTASW